MIPCVSREYASDVVLIPGDDGGWVVFGSEADRRRPAFHTARIEVIPCQCLRSISRATTTSGPMPVRVRSWSSDWPAWFNLAIVSCARLPIDPACRSESAPTVAQRSAGSTLRARSSRRCIPFHQQLLPFAFLDKAEINRVVRDEPGFRPASIPL